MREFFGAYGKVVDATVMVDRESGRSKGFGFVTFEDAANLDQLVGKIGLILDDKQARRGYFLLVVNETKAELQHLYNQRSRPLWRLTTKGCQRPI